MNYKYKDKEYIKYNKKDYLEKVYRIKNNNFTSNKYKTKNRKKIFIYSIFKRYIFNDIDIIL